MIHVMRGPGSVCRVIGPERTGLLAWSAEVHYAWTWMKVGGPVNGVRVTAFSRRSCERKVARAIARFHAHEGPSWEMTPGERQALRQRIAESLEARPALSPMQGSA